MSEMLPTETMVWISTKERLPKVGQHVLYLLVGAPDQPKVGFRDTPHAYVDRNGGSLDGWSLQSWWTERANEEECWEDEYVIYWCAYPELPQ